MLRARVCWVLYILGTATVLLSYTGIVSSSIGWVGWAIGIIGWILWPRTRLLPAYPMPEQNSAMATTPELAAQDETAKEP